MSRTWKKTLMLPARGPLQMPGAHKPTVIEAHAMELIKSMLYLADTTGQCVTLTVPSCSRPGEPAMLQLLNAASLCYLLESRLSSPRSAIGSAPCHSGLTAYCWSAHSCLQCPQSCIMQPQAQWKGNTRWFISVLRLLESASGHSLLKPYYCLSALWLPAMFTGLQHLAAPGGIARATQHGSSVSQAAAKYKTC